MRQWACDLAWQRRRSFTIARRPFLTSFSALVGESKPSGSKGNLLTTPDCTNAPQYVTNWRYLYYITYDDIHELHYTIPHVKVLCCMLSCTTYEDSLFCVMYGGQDRPHRTWWLWGDSTVTSQRDSSTFFVPRGLSHQDETTSSHVPGGAQCLSRHMQVTPDTPQLIRSWQIIAPCW